MQNSVKQGVNSHRYYFTYIYRILVIFFNPVLECYINNTYMGALSYTDSITISYPSLYGLNIMLDICNYFAKDNCVTFNKMETVYFKFQELFRPQ